MSCIGRLETEEERHDRNTLDPPASDCLRRACFVAALALQSGNAAASGIGLTYNNFEYGSAQVGVTCYGRYVHYRSDAFVTAGYGTWTLPEVQFYIGYDVIRNGRWVYAGEALPWTRAGGGGQFSAQPPVG